MNTRAKVAGKFGNIAYGKYIFLLQNEVKE
jgi:hypothetical protein